HQGLVLDPEIGSYQNRARQYAPGAKRYFQRDIMFSRKKPVQFSDGMNIYGYLRSSPLRWGDISGRVCCSTGTPPVSNGGWTCCDGCGGIGTPTACLHPTTAAGDSCVAQCTLEHEQQHATFGDCKHCCGSNCTPNACSSKCPCPGPIPTTAWPWLSDPLDPGSECAGFSTHADCMENCILSNGNTITRDVELKWAKCMRYFSCVESSTFDYDNDSFLCTACANGGQCPNDM
ncbi:MAG: hypothetical protein KDD77_05975, partial [Caldilineaceae bacterium]|nr:hypothetical protein [Caldilineaceae bacterium]